LATTWHARETNSSIDNTATIYDSSHSRSNIGIPACQPPDSIVGGSEVFVRLQQRLLQHLYRCHLDFSRVHQVVKPETGTGLERDIRPEWSALEWGFWNRI